MSETTFFEYGLQDEEEFEAVADAYDALVDEEQ